jgi:hypothetical protein
MRARNPVAAHGALPWLLVGVHSARFDMGNRDLNLDEALGVEDPWSPLHPQHLFRHNGR